MNNNNNQTHRKGFWSLSSLGNDLSIVSTEPDYDNMNRSIVTLTHFDEGQKEMNKANAEFICKAVNNYDKLKEDNALLLDALKGLYEFNLGKSDYLDTLLNNAESAILKAESK